MSRRPRRNHSPEFKAKAAQVAVKGDKALAEFSQQYDVHPNQITDWMNQLLSRAGDVSGADKQNELIVAIKTLHAKIGALTLEHDILESALTKAGLLSAKR